MHHLNNRAAHPATIQGVHFKDPVLLTRMHIQLLNSVPQQLVSMHSMLRQWSLVVSVALAHNRKEPLLHRLTDKWEPQVALIMRQIHRQARMVTAPLLAAMVSPPTLAVQL